MNYDEIQIGARASFSKTISEADVYAFAGITGDFNPVHIDAEAAKRSQFGERVAHGMIAAGMISGVLGTRLPGPGTIYLGQELAFRGPVKFGDTLTVVCEVLEKRSDKPIIKLSTTVTNQRGEEVVTGTATVKKKDQ